MNDAEVILDTNVVSYLMRGGSLAEAYAPHVQNRLLAITFVPVGELYFGAEKGKWGERKRRELEAALRNFVVIPYDHEIARCYGRLVAERQRICANLFAKTEAFQAPKYGKSEQMPGKMRGLLLESLPDILPLP